MAPGPNGAFDPKPILADLEELGFRPARLHTGLLESKATRFEARIVGTGPYAAGGQTTFLPGPRALAGHAWVDLTTFLGMTGFFNWQLAEPPEGREDGDPRPAPFWLPAQPWTLQADGADAGFGLQAAKAPLAAINNGDSGGPLFLESEGDWLLAGIACRSNFEGMQANGKTYSGRVTFWEALTGANLAWVQAVLAGTSDQDQVVTIPIPVKAESGIQAEPPAGTAAGARSREAKVVETKAGRTEAGESKAGGAALSAPAAEAADPG